MGRNAYLLTTAFSISLTCLSAHGTDDVFRRLGAIDFPRNQPVAFCERQKNRLLRKPIEVCGAVWLEHDGTMVMRVLKPHLEERRIERGQLVLRRPSTRVADNPDEAIAQAPARRQSLDPGRGAHLALWAAVQILSRNDDALRTRFTASSLVEKPDDTVHAWAVELIPRGNEARRKLRSIRLYGHLNQLDRMRVDQGPNRWRDMRLGPDPVEPANSQPTR